MNKHLNANLNLPSPATGIAFERLPDGNTLIEFQDDNGKTINTQMIACSLLRHLPVVVKMALVASHLSQDIILE
jgi:hypothetical protein